MATTDGWRDKIDQLKEGLQASNADLRARLAALEAKVEAAKLIAVVGSVILAILAALGTYDVWKDLKTLKITVADTKALTRDTQLSLIDALESELGSEGSLDGLRENHGARQQIKGLVARIQAIAMRLDENERSSYFRVGEALEPYLQQRCQDVIGILDKVKPGERERFMYAYMRGACLLGSGPTQEAEQWLATARVNSGGGTRALMATNLEALAKLYRWKSTKDEALVDEAIQILDSIIKRAPNFAPAYMNLASAYAAKKDYPLVTKTLARQRALQLRTRETIVQRIKEDHIRPTDGFLIEYVRAHLKVNVHYSDPSWESHVERALKI